MCLIFFFCLYVFINFKQKTLYYYSLILLYKNRFQLVLLFSLYYFSLNKRQPVALPFSVYRFWFCLKQKRKKSYSTVYRLPFWGFSHYMVQLFYQLQSTVQLFHQRQTTVVVFPGVVLYMYRRQITTQPINGRERGL